ncbi:MAG: NYN domain-containing protein [Candidatus Nomurabacteria bacterium]|jgi:uncharacterized LabA/DUF88 family protein|nr:NYN domain-containing protein [Candidatus Nomurabacteria bacterium]
MNQAFIDGQNLHLGTTTSRPSWKVDLERFRIYLQEKYSVDKAYYFLGAIDDNHSKMYEHIQEAGFILIFREHNSDMLSVKKGNVDTDIVFTIMRKIADREKLGKAVLVSGDGDYIKVVKYLIEKEKLAKVLAPSQKSFSSLYRSQIDNSFYDFLDKENIKRKIQYKKQKTGSR